MGTVQGVFVGRNVKRSPIFRRGPNPWSDALVSAMHVGAFFLSMGYVVALIWGLSVAFVSLGAGVVLAWGLAFPVAVGLHLLPGVNIVATAVLAWLAGWGLLWTAFLLLAFPVWTLLLAGASVLYGLGGTPMGVGDPAGPTDQDA